MFEAWSRIRRACARLRTADWYSLRMLLRRRSDRTAGKNLGGGELVAAARSLSLRRAFLERESSGVIGVLGVVEGADGARDKKGSSDEVIVMAEVVGSRTLVGEEAILAFSAASSIALIDAGNSGMGRRSCSSTHRAWLSFRGSA